MTQAWIAIVATGVAMWTGCLAAPGAESELTVTTTEAATTTFANDKAAFDFFVGKGLTSFQAAGIVGNLDQESGGDPGAVQFGGGPGRGIAQWSVGGRWDTSSPNVLAYAHTKAEPSGSLNLQLEFIWYELTTVGYGYAQLKATTNVTDATIAFMAKYEICGQCVSAQRVTFAKAVLAAYGVAADYGAKYVSQSWPLATVPLTIKCGEHVSAELVLTNTGLKAWDSATKLGTTMPRDRVSLFAGSDWVSPTRAAAIDGTIAPGSQGTFHFSFDAPSGDACVPGTYHEHFGVVQESVAWFSDSSGGPADDQIEALIELVPDDGGCAAGGTRAHASSILLILLCGAGMRRRRQQ